MILSSALIAVAAGGVVSYPMLRRHQRDLLETKHVKGKPDSSPYDSHILQTVALFTGALFGHRLRQNNLSELIDRLDFAVNEDDGWRGEFSFLAQHVNNLATQAGASDFSNSSDIQSEKIITDIMKPVSPRESRVMALISEDERNRRRMRSSTIPNLVWIYTNSGVPWKIRGYTTWPGIPKDTFGYTQPGPAYIC
jgi:hypothetical protein